MADTMGLGTGRSLVAGAIGATAVTLVNELARRAVPAAPRLDLLGERALARLRSPRGLERAIPGRRRRIRRVALAGDLASNAAYYALAVGRDGGRAVSRGLLWGTLAGVGAVVLAPWLGLGRRPSDASVETALMTVAWYGLGGLAAGLAARALVPPASIA